MAWFKEHAGTIFLAAVAFWLLAQRLGWFYSEEPEDPSSPLRHFSAATWEREVLASGKPVLVDFWAPWCGPCRSQGPIVSALAHELSVTALVGKVNVDQEGTLASRYGISGIPSLLVFRKGQVVKRYTGMTGGAELRRALEEAGR